MAGLEPFSPDADYCVYCHAPAAGMCAECGALCCVDCVELVMGWTTQRAVCNPCSHGSETASGQRSKAPYWLAAMILAALGTIFLLAQ